MIFCAHRWGDPVKVAEAHAVARWNGQMETPDPRPFERLAHGSVTYEQRCERCGQARTYEVLGAEVPRAGRGS